MQKLTLEDRAGEWLRHLRDDRRLADETIRKYRSSLAACFSILPGEFGPDDLQDALDRRLKHASPHVRYSSYTALAPFFSWWEADGGPQSPLRFMRRPRRSRAHRRALTEEELRWLALRITSATLKDRAIVLLVLRQGFRPKDIVQLHVEDLDFSGRRIRARLSKGNTDDWLPLSPTIADVLTLHLEQTGLTGGYVFTGPNGRMATRSVGKAWHRVRGPKLQGLVLYQLRHSYGDELIRLMPQINLNDVRRLMRHESLATTQLYLDNHPGREESAILSLDERLRAIGL